MRAASMQHEVEAGGLLGCPTYFTQRVLSCHGFIDTDQSNEKLKIRKQRRFFSHTCTVSFSYSIWVTRSPSGRWDPDPCIFPSVSGFSIPKRSAHYISSPLQDWSTTVPRADASRVRLTFNAPRRCPVNRIRYSVEL